VERIAKRWLIVWIVFVMAVTALVAYLEVTGFFDH
jgi:hypothetical protein